MKITDRVHALKIPFTVPVAPGVQVDRFVYSYVLFGPNVVCLIDSGVAGSESIIFECIGQAGRRPEDVRVLVQTHAHPDHLGATKAIKEATGCSVVAHPAEIAWIEDVELQARQRPVPGFHALVGGSVKVDREMRDGDVIVLDHDLALDVVHVPGHSAGSVALFLADEGVVFSGDAIPLPGDMPVYEDAIAVRSSIERLRKLADVRCLLASWDDPRTGDAVRGTMTDGLAWLETVGQAVATAMAMNRSANDRLELCRLVVGKLGLPPVAVNPLVAASLEAEKARVTQRQ